MASLRDTIVSGASPRRTAIQRPTITCEYPTAEGGPYYPAPRPENEALDKRDEALALARPEVWFVGRLAAYRYYNMDQVAAQALATFRRIQERLPAGAAASEDGELVSIS